MGSWRDLLRPIIAPRDIETAYRAINSPPASDSQCRALSHIDAQPLAEHPIPLRRQIPRLHWIFRLFSIRSIVRVGTTARATTRAASRPWKMAMRSGQTNGCGRQGARNKLVMRARRPTSGLRKYVMGDLCQFRHRAIEFTALLLTSAGLPAGLSRRPALPARSQHLHLRRCRRRRKHSSAIPARHPRRNGCRRLQLRRKRRATGA